MTKKLPKLCMTVGVALLGALECSGRWVTSYSTEACRVRDGRLGLLVKAHSSEYGWTLIEGPRRTGAEHSYLYWVDVDYEAIWNKSAPPICVQPLFRADHDVSIPSLITEEPAVLAWVSRWEKMITFDIGKRSWCMVQEAPPGEFVYTGVYGGPGGDLAWTRGGDIYTYDFGAAGFRRVGLVPQCKAELGDEVWCEAWNAVRNRERRRAVVLGTRTVLWSEELRDETMSRLSWYDVPTGAFLGKLSFPASSKLVALAWNGASLVFAFRDASGAVSIATEAGHLPNKQQMCADMGILSHRMLLSTTPPALLAIGWQSSERRSVRHWDFREWRYLQGLYRTGTLSVAVSELKQPDKRFCGYCVSEPCPNDTNRPPWAVRLKNTPATGSKEAP